ncbi:nuclease-related domain-containing DEAD/DEAH box helicase [Actinorhabdospora filicis]|nr:NERD domain-containing protein [Actinorhabdospora filicis]
MIPSVFDQTNSSSAERRMFHLLASLVIDGWEYCFHSVNLPVHEKQRECEIDFLLLGERGILVIEVKGGAVACVDGAWTTTSRNGRSHTVTRSPFDQAREARHALEKRLATIAGKDIADTMVFGHCVAFPEIDFDVDGVEWDSATVIHRPQLAAGQLASALDLAGRYWERKQSHRAPLTTDTVADLCQAIRPMFDRVQGFRTQGRLIEAQLHRLTEQQYRMLDLSAANPRLLIEGGAGTGKTLLAAELARRSAPTGTKAALTCHSNILASFLQRQKGILAENVIPFALLKDAGPGTVGTLIVDEAQDVINERDLDVIDRVLRGGLADGNWTFLLDVNNQRGLVGAFEDSAMERLSALRPARMKLTENCRNTPPIVTATRDRTAADVGLNTMGFGDPVEFVEAGRAEAAVRAARVLDEFEEGGVAMHDVVLLSPVPFRESLFGMLPSAWRARVDVLDLLRHRRLETGRIGFARVADFKGLERRYVLLEEPADLGTAEARRVLYVGMTRARAGLWIFTTGTGEV